MSKIALYLFVLLLSVSTRGQTFTKYYEEAKRIVGGMSLDQKIGQTMQVDFYAITNDNGTSQKIAQQYNLGSLLVGGNGCPDENGNLAKMPDNEQQTKKLYASATGDKWKKLADKFLSYSMNVVASDQSNYKIKTILATDAVHNNQHVSGTILFPHNIGLANSHNPQHFYNTGYWTGKNVKETGFNYAFAPTVAVSHNPQWGRYYETMGQNPQYIAKYAKAYTEGLQLMKDGKVTSGVIGSVKHFLGDGATLYGADQGNDNCGNYSNFVQHNIQGYITSINSGIGTVMCSYSGINWIPMAIGPQMGVILREKLGFDGFIISDYDEITKVQKQTLPTDFQNMQFVESIATIMNAGVDMFMFPAWYGERVVTDYFNALKEALNKNYVPMQRLNEAVLKITAVKMAMGLVQKSNSGNLQMQLEADLGQKDAEHKYSTDQYEDSLQAVHESMVLLKNENKTLPLTEQKLKNLKYIVLVGEMQLNLGGYELFRSYDNIGMQCGGWSLRWNGFMGNSQWQDDNKIKSKATSMLDALKALNLKEITLVYPEYTSYTNQAKVQEQRNQFLTKLKEISGNLTASNTLILSVVGQVPYAEFMGDINVPYCQDPQWNKEGCMYGSNGYTPSTQSNNFAVDFNQKFDKKIISQVRSKQRIPMATIVFAGRPVLIEKPLEQSEALIHAFLPGTSGGQGVIDALIGKYIIRAGGKSNLKNSLSMDYPKTMDSLKDFPIYTARGGVPKIKDALFEAGYGLSTSQ